jgi:hypothetical protein
MSTVQPYPSIESLTLTEENGRNTNYVLTYLITGLAGTGAQVAFNALTDLATAGIENDTISSFDGNLQVTSRSVEMVPNTPDAARVTVVFQPLTDAERDFYFSTTASLSQENTQVDIYGNEVTVSHTYPADDPDFPSEEKTTGVEIPVLRPEVVRTATGIVATDNPNQIVYAYIGRVNLFPWGGAATNTWLCTDASYVPYDLNLQTGMPL